MLILTPVWFVVVILALWVLWEYHLEKNGRQPIMPPSLWKQPHFSALCGVGKSLNLSISFSALNLLPSVVLTWWSYNAVIYYINLYFQNVQHFSPLHSGMNYIPTVIVAIACKSTSDYESHWC